MVKSLLAKSVLTKYILGAVLIAVLGTGIYQIATQKGHEAKAASLFDVDPAFASYVSGFTSGVVSSETTIQVRFMEGLTDSIGNTAVDLEDLFDFTPSIKGTTKWSDDRTLEFTPEKQLPFDETYVVSLKLDKIFPIAEEKLKEFEFGFRTIPLFFEVEHYGIEYSGSGKNAELGITGKVICSDFVDSTRVRKVLIASQNGDELPLKWSHDKGGRYHKFYVGGLSRKDEEGLVKLSYSGDEFKVDVSGEETVTIPSLNQFTCVANRVVQVPDQYVLLSFSDPLDLNQNLVGLVKLGGLDVDFDIIGNQIKIMPTTRQNGQATIYINKAIKNFEGDELAQDITLTAEFEQLKPQVRWVGNTSGSILPTTGPVLIPIEAVGLNEIEVEVIRIYEKNIVQFLQTNDLDGNEQLRRVGSPVKRETISLVGQGVANLSKWNRYTLDITKLVSQEPGAIHQVRLFFGRRNSAYQCENAQEFRESEGWQLNNGREFNSWDSYSYYYSGDYNYRERENPCHPMYYRYHGQAPNRNFLVSDIGLMAKKGKFNNLYFTVTDMLSAKPLPQAKVEVVNFQQQVIGSTTVSDQGLGEIEVEGTPFLIVASHGEQKTYLKIDNNSSLSLSHFNTSGTVNQDGYKGTIYGERGVWRPGDSLFLSFVLEDKEKRIPAGTPVIMELTDPLNKLQERVVQTQGVNGVYAFKMATSDDASTGNWSAKVKVGNSYFHKTVPIETIKPNRLKINIDFGKEELSALEPEINGKLNVKWLHGAVAKNLRAKIEAVVTSTSTHFKDYPNFGFDDIAKHSYAENFQVFDGELDENGDADIYTELKVNSQSSGKLIANLKTTVYEKSGNTSVDRFSIPYFPFTSYVGMRVPDGSRRSNWLQTDTPQTFEVVALSPNGKPLKENRNVKIEVYKVGWRWWWDRSRDNISSYLSSSSSNLLVSETQEIKKGKGKFTFTIERPNWGRFYVRVTDLTSGHTSGRIVYYEWPWWAGRPAEQRGESVLEFSADNESYDVGQKAHFKIPSTPEGKALISLENGTKVVKQFWVETQKGQTEFDVDVTAEMAPNIYVHATLLQPHANTENDLPIRLYGVSSIGVEDPETRLAPELEMPDVLRPEQEFEVKISEATGKPMTYTLAVVDEGLLDLTRFKTPELWDFFYAKEALGVSTYDMYNEVIGAQSGELKRILGIGGGGDGGDAKPEGTKVNRFKPVVRFIGPFELKKGKTTTHKIKMPYYVGSVRTMLVASQNGAYGSTEKTTPVRQPLMVLGTLPRVLGPGEEVLLPVSVFAMEEHVKNATVSVETNELFEIVGPSSQNLSFNKIGEEMAYFKLKVLKRMGAGNVKIVASSKNEKAQDAIDIEVRNPNPMVTQVFSHVLEGNSSVTANFETVGLPGTNSGSIEVSSIPPIDLEKRLKYLIRYPHGCIEQTTSSVFPQLYLAEITDLTPEMEAEIQTNVQAGIDRISNFQTPEGGFSYWPGHIQSSTWGTNYAGHFLIEAQRKGYNVPKSMLKSWRKYQKRMSGYYNKTDETWRNAGLEQAYRLYLLALNQTPDMGSMNRLKANEGIHLTTKWRLAAAYAMAGQKETAKEIIRNLGYEIEEYRELSYSYGSNIRDRAMILETLVELGETKKAALLLQSLSNDMNDRWMSTQTTAYCLLAIGKYAKINKMGDDINFNYTYPGASARNASTGLPLASVSMKESEILSGSVKIENNTGSVVYLRVITSGKPLNGDTTNAENDLNLVVAYKDMDGNAINPTNIEQGTQFYADVTLTNPGWRNHYREMALTQIFPSGWEIVNTRMDGTANFFNASTPTYQDIRDDRVYTYYDLNRHETKTYRIILTASFVGKYYLPAVSSEAMYDNTISAHKAGKWVEVTEIPVP